MVIIGDQKGNGGSDRK